MSRFRLRIAVFSCYVALVAAPVLAHARGQPTAYEGEIRAENARWADAYARGDYTAIGELYTDDGTLLPPGTDRVVGPVAIATYFAKKLNGSAPHTVSFSDFEFYGDGEAMTEISNTEIRDHSGKLVARGKQTLIFRKQDGAWKLHRDMWNYTDL
ncbi:DUF4440 domain-containing protein [Paraburkholderia caribensis]|uniref:YybH family protein n=1 Tax=Paraburkholderia caribensis TaxID=75105 RepID=UPI00079FE6D4